MKLLVTGGAGFIGSNYIYYVQKTHPEDEIVCLDLMTYASIPQTLDAARKRDNFRFVQGDISDRELVFALFEQERFDAVVNFAAESHVDRSIENPGVFLTTNILGTQVLMDACRAFNVGRFHQISTDEVYGDLPLDRPDLLFTEQSPIRASSPYSASKASADLLVLAYHRTFGLPITISRCSNNYGPYQFPEKLISLSITNALENKSLPVYARGENVRDWIYVEDHCSAVDLIVRQGRVGEIYNVGGSSERRNIDVVCTILARMSKPDSLIEYVGDRPGHDLRYAIDAAKIMAELGWHPQTGFDAGIDATIAWFRAHPEWVAAAKRKI